MPKYLVTRTRYFEQTDTVIVEAEDAPAAQLSASDMDSPIDHEYLTHAPELYVTTRVQEVARAQLASTDLPAQKRFSNNLRRIRKERRLSLRVLGQLSGLSHTAIRFATDGRNSPKLETVEMIANALGVPITEMLSEPEQLSEAA